MLSLHNHVRVCALFFITVIISGCYDNLESFKDLGNEYTGYLETSVLGTKGSLKNSVSARFELTPNNELSVIVLDANQSRTENIIFKPAQNRLLMTGWSLHPDPIKLQAEADNCFTPDKTFSPLATLIICLRHEEISLDYSERKSGASDQEIVEARTYKLLLDNKPLGAYETPQVFSLSEIVKRTSETNFETRIQYESYLQGKYRTKNAYGNLLPHISANSIIGLATVSGFVGALSVVGDLLPFLLPSRWYQAKQNKETEAALKLGTDIVKADATQVALSLALAIVRDGQVASLLEANQKEIFAIYKELLNREKLGQFAPGTALDIKAVIDQMEQDRMDLASVTEQNRISLSYTLGLQNPHAITGLVDDLTDNIKTPIVVDENALQTAAFEKALELQQIDKLITASQYATKQSVFNWLDPAGDSNGGLGFGLPSYVMITKSATRQLRLQKDQLSSTLHDKVANAALLNHLALAHDQSGEKLLADHSGRVKRYLQMMKFGTGFPIMELSGSLVDRTRAQVNQLSVNFDYRMNLTLVRRLQMLEQTNPASSQLAHY